ncbi:uncharacterized protein LOC133919884 [Phragmites australis]|uniref:uncharacterized protein LOC133919884 n=1 Tax=Phragmites australis TaxID=29695 RepID=UPI002D773371|nr:uncharacterized protein LOC133919884 [Phragmites australis]
MSGDMARAEVSPEGAAPGFGVDLYEQATKALALRTPFEGEEVPPRNPTLPARLVSWAGPGDGRKKHKKAQPPPGAAAAEHPPQEAVARPAKAGAWEQFEAYFRPVTLDDVEMLRPKFPFGYSKLDSCMLIPFLGSGKELMNKVETFDVAVTETSSYLGVGGEEVISKRERGEQNVHLVNQKERSEQSVEQDIHDVVVQQMVSDKELNRQGREQGIHEVSVQLGERAFEVYEAGSSGGIVSAQCVEEEGTSLNWLLCAKGRFVLTSERPNKKRKLLGVDAGLEQLVLLPRLGAEVSSSCDVCCLGESAMMSNRIVNCSNCKVSVHQKCYGLHAVPDGQWLCAWCTYLESTGSLNKDAGSTQSVRCVLCPKDKGALKRVKVEPTQNAGVGHLKFVHLFCSLWTPEVVVEDMESMEPVTNLRNVQENRMQLMCSICKVKHGACVRCSHGTCRTAFHPICARDSKHQMEIWGNSGHPNVELRAFCSKHSAVGYISSLENSNNASEQSPTESRPNNTNLITGKIPKLRFTRKNKDKFMNCETETSTSSSGNLIRVETIEQGDLPHTVRNANAQPIGSWETDTPSVGGDHMRSSGDIAAVLRKPIDSGDVSVDDIASEVGISSESLEAALVGETTTFSHGLKLKIIKWLQNSAHMHAGQGSALKGSSVVVQDDKPDGSDATQTVDVKCPLVPDDDKGALVDALDSAVIKPSPTRSKSNNKVLKDKSATCATGAIIFQNGNKNMVKEGANLERSPAEEFEKESEFSPIGSKDVSEEQGKLILNTSSGNKEFSTSTEIPNENPGVLLGRKINDLTEAELGSELEEGVSSPDHSFSQGFNAKNGVNSVENGIGTPRDCDPNCFHGQPFFNFDDSRSYIHPLIKKKMAHHWDITFKQNSEAPYYHEEPSYPSHEKASVDSLVKLEDTTETTATDQVLNSRSLKILEHSPDDEVEGEMVYLQARLLDNAFVLKHRYEKLIAKVVQNLSRELDAFSKRKWDLILVHQFLRDVREAKKRGRKEKRHKEAQAVLAAAAAAVASSSRTSTMRKDVKENAAPVNQESSPKLAAGSARVGQRTSSLPRTKDPPKSSNSKVSPDNNFGSFHMPISSKENPLYCDVCMRTETVLNRIFVCSRCKAAVHIDCYRNLYNSVGPWNCEFCEDVSSEAATISDQSDCNGRKVPFARCGVCHGTSGAFRKTADAQWVHAFCAEWLLGTKYVRGQDNPVEGMKSLVDGKDTCCVCLRRVGMCLRCDSGDCHITFHPTCARNSGFYMNTKGFGTTSQHKAYCGKHSVQQKVVDAQQYGPEELKTMKRMRVQLEKLRLLCERIIKREKVKRETVLCDHDILAKTKDTVVFSYLASGASSESATTSVNNKSYSGTVQRSDDVTVDSTISGKKTIRFSLNNRDAERNTADSSRTLISFKRKLGERGSHAGKQLPQRLATASQKLGGEKTKDKRESFQKELVMTSDQASTQNQRLPKGYVYVPRDSLSKEKPSNRNTQAHNPQEPGG